MAYSGLAAQTRNFGAASQLPPGMGGPVIRRPGNGLTGQFSSADEAARLGMGFPGASQADLDSTANAEMAQHQFDRNQAMLPYQPDPILSSVGPQTSAPENNPALNPMLQSQNFGLPGTRPIHRAGGGPARRTRQFAQGTAAVPYGWRGQEIVSGGTGASPALPGRIGYRGQLQAAPDEQEGAGISWLNQGAIQQALNQGARQEINPVTGLSMNPTKAEINAQLKMIAGQGDEKGLKGQGVGGSARAKALSDYYQAKQSGDPAAIGQATQNVQNLKRNLDTLRSQNPNNVANQATNAALNVAGATGAAATPGGAPNASNPAANGADGAMPATPIGQSVPPPAVPGATAGASAGVGDSSAPPAFPTGAPFNPGQDARKKGGPVADIHPYIVNEKGEEAFKPKGGKPELMPGPEHMTTFSKDGTVIPHGRTMKMLSKGMIQPTEANPDFPATPRPSQANTKAFMAPTEANPQNPIIAPVKHDETGQVPVDSSHWWNIIPWAPESPLLTGKSPEQIHGPLLPPVEPRLFPANSPLGKTGDFIQKSLNSGVNGVVSAAKWPFVDPDAKPDFPYGNPLDYSATLPEPQQEDNYDSEVNDIAPSGTPQFPTGPAFHPGEEEPAPIASTKEGSNWLDAALQNFRAGKQQAQSIAAPLVQAKQAIMQEPGVSALPAPARTASFLTPYGTASVTQGNAPTAGPHVFNADGTAWTPPARRMGGKVSRTRMMASMK